MTNQTLDDLLEHEPSFRKTQILELVYGKNIDNWEKATSLPADLRHELAHIWPLNINARETVSADKARKALITLYDNKKIETVLLSHESGRKTVCVSSQVGCPLGCVFCKTGQIGFERNLEPFEILDQVHFFSTSRINNVVFMGMGEPFLNYKNVSDAIKLLNDSSLFNIGSRHISLSTVGICEYFHRFADDFPEVNLAISLHAANDKLRQTIMPISKKYKIRDILLSTDEYIAKTHRKVMFEYLMLGLINDSPKDALELSHLLKNRLCFVNLIAYNETGKFKSSSIEKIFAFKKILEKNNIQVTIRHKFGEDISAACGQLATST